MFTDKTAQTRTMKIGFTAGGLAAVTIALVIMILLLMHIRGMIPAVTLCTNMRVTVTAETQTGHNQFEHDQAG